MIKIFVIFAFVVLLVVFLQRRMRTKVLDPETAKALMNSGGQILDVRSNSEFASRHLEGAVNIPLPELAKRHAELGDKDRPVILHCASGVRSARAAKFLQAQGFSRVYDIASMAAWPL